MSPEIRRRPIPMLMQDADQEEESEEEIQMVSIIQHVLYTFFKVALVSL